MRLKSKFVLSRNPSPFDKLRAGSAGLDSDATSSHTDYEGWGVRGQFVMGQLRPLLGNQENFGLVLMTLGVFRYPSHSRLVSRLSMSTLACCQQLRLGF